jgi:MFS family permease
MSRTDLAQDGTVLVAALTRPEHGLAAVIARRRSLTALAVATLASLLFTAVAVPRVDYGLGGGPDGPKVEEMTPHQVEEARLQAAKIGAVAGYAGALLGPAFLVLGGALALWLAFKVAGTRPGLKATVAVAAHAFLPIFLAQLLALPAVLQKAPVGARELPSLLPSSLAALLPPGASPVLTALASSFDLFTLWAVVLLVIGMAKAAGATRLRAAVVVGVLWAAQVGVLKIAPAAAAAARTAGPMGGGA